MSNELFQYNPVHHYQLILDLPFNIKKKITDMKKELHHDHVGGSIYEGSPLIYLADFKQYDANEIAMIDALNNIALGYMPFKIHLKNFGYSDQGEIFVSVEHQAPINFLINQLEAIAGDLIDSKFNKNPRVSILRKIHHFQLAKSWAHFQHQHFSATYVVAEMLLLKHIVSINSWQILKRMQFQNLAIPSTHSSAF